MLGRAGDLEVAMNDQQVHKQLLELPETALVALLSDDRLAVAAESMVVALTMQWAEQHELATVPDAVACCIRLKHLQCGYIAGVTRWFPQWTVEVVALLSAGQASPAAWRDVRQMENSPQVFVGTSELERPKSPIQAAEF
eukprot:TRINITY_DN5423_c0_g5_i1.p1 TRINITY_DN5423_c0_g5~~TRINITY_DN5423_c0_g5_i1.p1  ORF type:complete len:140 (-),score=31.25 TRINITY_DN5423_c0_g5_i1:487-906(-)